MDKKLFDSKSSDNSFAGSLLVATPLVQGSCFDRSVVYMCAHDGEGAMGVIINSPVSSIEIKEIFEQLNLEQKIPEPDVPIHFGGPVESYRGFIMHSADHAPSDALYTKDGIVVSANMDVMQKIANGSGPNKGLLMLGYAGWSAGQLESEIESGSWIVIPATKKLIFDTSNEDKWSVATSSLGFDMGHFSTQVGHA